MMKGLVSKEPVVLHQGEMKYKNWIELTELFYKNHRLATVLGIENFSFLSAVANQPQQTNQIRKTNFCMSDN